MQLILKSAIEALSKNNVRQINGGQLLSMREAIELRPLRSGSLICQQGQLWVTTEAHLKDQILQAGDSLNFDSGKGIFIQALQESSCVFW